MCTYEVCVYVRIKFVCVGMVMSFPYQIENIQID